METIELEKIVKDNLEKHNFQPRIFRRYSYYKITEEYRELGLSF